MSKQKPVSPQEMIGALATRWQSTESMPQQPLLRLSILRELVRALHAEKSWCLASGYPDEAQDFHVSETHVDKLSSEKDLTGDLPSLIRKAEDLPDADPFAAPSPAGSGGTQATALPKEVQAILPSEKIERFDRHWERALVREAVKLGWEFWELKAHVRVESAHECEIALTRGLGTHGIILFADSAGELSDFQAGVWPGKWLMVIEPGFDPKSVALAQIPGLALSPNPPQWTLLHRIQR